MEKNCATVSCIINLPHQRKAIINMNEVILESQKFIENHLEEKILLNDIAAMFGYSEYHFSRIFTDNVGISVMEYVKRRRLVRAAQDIMDGMSIIEAAFKYSYDSHSGFTKAFKKEFGYSPSLLCEIMMQVKDLTGGSNMSKLFVKQVDEKYSKEELFEILQECIKLSQIHCDMTNIRKAFDFSKRAYEGVKRYSGEEYITHPLNVAIILADIGAGENLIIAGLMCDIYKKTNAGFKELTKMFSEEVVSIVNEVNNYNVRLEPSCEDVLLVKLAERLHNMRTVRNMDESKWTLKAKETIEYYVPIARRIGNDALIEELNKLSIKYV